jgi:anti-anti-sigma factor
MTLDSIPPFQLEVCWDGVVAVTVTGEVDTATAPALTRRLREVAAAHPERLVLDLGGLVFADVASARALDSAHQALEKKCPVIPVILRAPRPFPPADVRPHQADEPSGRG